MVTYNLNIICHLFLYMNRKLAVHPPKVGVKSPLWKNRGANNWCVGIATLILEGGVIREEIQLHGFI